MSQLRVSNKKDIAVHSYLTVSIKPERKLQNVNYTISFHDGFSQEKMLRRNDFRGDSFKLDNG